MEFIIKNLTKNELKRYIQTNQELVQEKIKALINSSTQFQVKVWQETVKIPAGKTITYQELAARINHPKAHRAVANVLGQNQIPYFIPCHRVIRKDGSLGGYKWGVEVKKKLLELEKDI
jgi:O-6-methylguanine DNA methyltransferase